jgi:methionyl-tRNA synthetase
MNQTILAQEIMQQGFLSGKYVLFIILVSVWEILWKGIALWRSARNKQLIWFLLVLILNTLGILPIIYLVFFSKSNKKQNKK